MSWVIFDVNNLAWRAYHTTGGLKIQAVDTERGYILVRGAIPGPRGGLVLVRSAAKGA